MQYKSQCLGESGDLFETKVWTKGRVVFIAILGSVGIFLAIVSYAKEKMLSWYEEDPDTLFVTDYGAEITLPVVGDDTSNSLSGAAPVASAFLPKGSVQTISMDRF